MLPDAILFDMDDTLISAYAGSAAAWQDIAAEFAHALGPVPHAAAAEAIATAADRFWADEDRHRWGRLNQHEARTGIVAEGFDALARAGHTVPAPDLHRTMALRYATYRDERMHVLDGAHATVDWFRAQGVRVALVTNGPSDAQRAKIERFDLGHRFDHIQIEGEHGFGKPDPRAYRHALSVLGTAPGRTWMVGDNLEWEVAAPQRLGIVGIWRDAAGQGLPPGTAFRPHRIVRSVAELLPPGVI
jgi:putative hydrolase of the HAD superfamily